MHVFEVLLELVELGAEVLALSFDVSETLLALWDRVDVELPLSFSDLTLLRWAQLGEALCSKSTTITEFFAVKS